MTSYKAHWGWDVIVVSGLAVILCLAIAAALLLELPGGLTTVAALPLVIVAASALFTVRGYDIHADAIVVHRLLWKTRVPRAGLQSARFEPDAMRHSIRTFGNGGLFGFTGFFSNKPLGPYRAFVTDRHGTVVLRFASQAVVLSPSTPQQFADELSRAKSTA